MNTTFIGTDFENKVFKYFSSLLDNDNVPAAPKKHSEIFQHKVYQSFGSQRKIDFDITIETYNPFVDGKSWSSLVVIECKCYNRKLDISDFDEFRSKLSDISQSGVKGIMVTTKGFTRTEIESAKKAHIGLVVVSENCKEWLVCRDINNRPEQIMPILLGEKESGFQPIAYSDGMFVNILDMLKDNGVVISDKNIIDVPYLTNEELMQKASDLRRSNDVVTNDIAGEILAKVYPNINIMFDDLPEGLLGTFSFSENIITLSNEIKEDIHRRNFTLAHEIGHLYLHKSILHDHLSKLNDYEENQITAQPDKIIQGMEYQANLFASFLLIPQKRFVTEVALLFREFNITKGYLYLDYQPCNKKDVYTILDKLSISFNVSKEAIKMRLLNAKLLIIDNKGPQRIDRFFIW